MNLQSGLRGLGRHYRDIRCRLMTGGRAEPARAVKIEILDESRLIADSLRTELLRVRAENERMKLFLEHEGVSVDFVLGRRKIYTPTLAKIFAAVCNYYGVTSTDVRSTRRAARLSLPRHVFYYLARCHTLASYSQVGRFLANRDHSTVQHGDRKIAQLISEDGGVRRAVEEITARIYEASDDKCA